MTPIEVAAIQRTLAGEHAAVFAYGVVGGGLPVAERGIARTGATAHRLARDRLTRVLQQAGAHPVGAQAAYASTRVVGNRSAALALAAEVEDALAVTYDALVAAVVQRDLRTLALAGLQQAAVQAARLRRLGGSPEPAVAFPGR